jgi:hypothetical protein
VESEGSLPHSLWDICACRLHLGVLRHIKHLNAVCRHNVTYFNLIPDGTCSNHWALRLKHLFPQRHNFSFYVIENQKRWLQNKKQGLWHLHRKWCSYWNLAYGREELSIVLFFMYFYVLSLRKISKYLNMYILSKLLKLILLAHKALRLIFVNRFFCWHP